MAGKKTPLNYGKLIFIGFLWTLVYLQIMSVGCFLLFDFNPLSAADWYGRLHAFVNSRWIIDTAADFGLFSCMILFVPLWILGWWGLYRIRWMSLIPRRFFEKKLKREAIKVVSSKKGFTPHKLRVQSSALLSVAPIVPSAPVASVPYTGDGLPHPYPDTPDDMMDNSEVPEDMPFDDADDVQAVLPLTVNTQADFFPHISMNGNYASFALSTDSRAIVVRVINQPGSTWVADTEADIAESDWYCESRILKTPVKDVIEIAKSLQESEPNSIAVPVILMMSGTLLNPVETRDYLEKNNVMLLRLEDMDSEDIPLFTAFLDEYFGSKWDAASADAVSDGK